MTQTDQLAGKTLGDYRLLNKLTSGGMAHIYIGEDENLGRKAAIKVLTEDMAGDNEMMRERFEREARAIGRLEHDNIVPIYQFGKEDDLYFLAMRYIEGNTLADEMNRHAQQGTMFPIERALNILAQVADALDYAHRQGIIHRDVKPSNVLLGANDKAVLSDFGLVLWEAVDQTLGTAFGTPRYISPEQATDSQSAVPQSDIYSLAVIVYEMLTNELVFEGNTPMEVALSHITETPTPPRAHNSDIPANAQNEIMKALQKDAHKRHKTAAAFITSLKKAYELIDTESTSDEDDEAAAQKAKLNQRGGKTIAFRKPEPALDMDETSPEEVFSQWGDQTIVDSPDTDSDDASTDKRQLIVIAAVLLAVVIGAGALFLGGDGDNATTAANPTPRPTQAATPLPAAASSDDGLTIEMRYTDNFFALLNTADAPVEMNGLELRGASGNELADNFGATLAPGGCVLLERSTSESAPAAWGCGAAQQVLNSNASLFWRADSTDDETFSALRGGRVIQTCDTVGRAVGRAGEQSCELTLPEA